MARPKNPDEEYYSEDEDNESYESTPPLPPPFSPAEPLPSYAPLESEATHAHGGANTDDGEAHDDRPSLDEIFPRPPARDLAAGALAAASSALDGMVRP